MREVYWFNPESDLALAHGSDNYTAPPWARLLRHDLQLLPAWLMPTGATLLVDDAAAAQEWLDRRGLAVEAVQADRLPSLGNCRYHPWGWSAATRRDLLRMGANVNDLPSRDDLRQVHRLAHRDTSIIIHELLAAELGRQLSPIPLRCDELETVLRFVNDNPGCYIKAPWSGSGHGIYHVTEHPGREFTQWCAGVLRRQGSVTCEQGLARELDFAVEFACEHGQCRVVGYSVFDTDAHDQYVSGLVDTTAMLHRIISEHYPDFDQVVVALTTVLNHVVAPHYSGPVGVDMLLYRQADGQVEINPCVEVNVRQTMGMLAAALGNRHHLQGRFVIVHDMTAIDDAHLLTPVTPITQHAAIVRPQ